MNHTTSHVVFLFVALSLIKISSTALLKWTDINCQVLEGGKNYMDFEHCYLKAVRRNYVEIFLKLLFYQLPITKARARIQLWKRANGFRPFLYNIEFDLCKLLNSANYHTSFEKFNMVLITELTKRNFSCPWNIAQLTADHIGIPPTFFKLPMPTGTYRMDFTVTTNGIQRYVFNITYMKEE